MKITIESTEKIVELQMAGITSINVGVPARIWVGTTESGIKVHCYITRIAIDKEEPRADEFENELLQQRTPTADIQAIPSRLIL